MDVKFIDDWKVGLIELRDEVSVAPLASFVATSHPNDSFIDREYEIHQEKPILVDRGAWIGTGAVILPGVTIGEGAIIGAHAVVTHTVPPYSIVAGVPARLIGDVRQRFKRRH